MTLKEKISNIITERIITNPEIFLVEVLVSDKAKQKIVVLLDGDKGVDIDQCAEVSRQLGEIIEAELLIEDAYILEVSSPGLDFPLKFPRQYTANIGRMLRVETKEGSFFGKITTTTETNFSIELEIKKSKTQIKKDLAAGIPAPEPIKTIEFAEVKKALIEIKL